MRKRTGAIHCDNQEEYIRVLFFIINHSSWQKYNKKI